MSFRLTIHALISAALIMWVCTQKFNTLSGAVLATLLTGCAVYGFMSSSRTVRS